MGFVYADQPTNSNLFDDVSREAKESAYLSPQAACCEDLGQYTAAVAASTALQQSDAVTNQAAIAAQQGAAYLAAGDFTRAWETLEEAAAAARSEPAIAASILNDLGRVYMAIERPLYAIAAFDDARRLAPVDDHALLFSAGINLAKALVSIDETGASTRILSTLGETVGRVDDPVLRARYHLTLGLLFRETLVEVGAPAIWRKRAYAAFDKARRYAEATGDTIVQSYALGYMGRLYEDERRWESALRYTREAALLAQRLNSAAILYQWQWQVARIFKARGDLGQSLTSYRLAADTLADVRLDIASRSFSSFENGVAPLYLEYADLLLATTAQIKSVSARQTNLRSARDALEQLRVAEIEDYFEDECAVNEDRAQIEQMSAKAAVLYPVVLPDRIELLLSLPSGLSQTTVAVDEETLSRFARRLRVALEDPTSGDDYRPYAEMIYDWIIRPVEPSLASISTLVVVPAGALRTIPIAVLHDGERFLIERHAVAISPGLTLTGAGSALSTAEAHVQINGLTKTVRGFPPLPHVANEIASISALYSSDVNRDAGFTADTMETELAEKAYDFVHIATHGQFHSDPRQSFLLTHDELITMDRLENILGLRQYVSDPVDLLFLSACQTAAGDDRAALGLAGVAVKSGADSVVASLWLINDESTARLVAEFYRSLQSSDGNKAQALQAAQLSLLRDERHAHPNYWAPFLLVGNWL